MTSRELDALVAERVMGWTLMVNEPGGDPAIVDGARMVRDTAMRMQRCPPFSTTGDGMLAVVEEMAKRGHRIVLRYTPYGAARAEADFSPSVIERSCVSDTAPRAVCLAALRALGVEA